MMLIERPRLREESSPPLSRIEFLIICRDHGGVKLPLYRVLVLLITAQIWKLSSVLTQVCLLVICWPRYRMSDDIEHKSDINLVIPLINKLLAVARAGPVNNFHPSLWVLPRQREGGREGGGWSLAGRSQLLGWHERTERESELPVVVVVVLVVGAVVHQPLLHCTTFPYSPRQSFPHYNCQSCAANLQNIKN